MSLWFAEKEFSREDEFSHKVEKLSREIVQHKMQADLMRAHFEDFRQEVALEIPGNKFLKPDDRLRDLASIIPHSPNLVPMDDAISRKNLKLALALHEEKKYEEATQGFLKVVSEYPESTSSLEASYYLAQSFYLTGNKQEALVWSEKMLKQFPDSLWTAKALLITADIYKEQERKNDVIEIYQMIINTFDSAELKEDVKRRMADMGS